ncbi:hypothetical protein O3M35_007661 [Rhynocoris fuscipes]|uniref:Uncharacterized protein n=1 Tax=Rhynocoris fuscipes TaxID=488301 RepID=A0AAW1DFW8_9HEMI
MRIRKRLTTGQKIFLIGFIIYIIVCITVYLTFIVINNFRTSDCPKGKYILTFHDSDDISIRLWSYISIWAISKTLTKWNPYAPLNVLESLSIIFEKYFKFDNFNDLSENCRRYGDTYPKDFVKLNFQDDPYQFADLIFIQQHNIKQYFQISINVLNEVATFLKNKLTNLKFNDINVNTFVMIAFNQRSKYDRNFTNVYTKVKKDILEVSEPLFIFMNDLFDSEDVMDDERVVMKPEHFNISHELYLAKQCRYLILDGSHQSTLYSLFSHNSQVHIYKPEDTIKAFTKKFKNWHHYD